MVDQYRRVGAMPTPDHFDPADPEIQKDPYAYYPVLRGIHTCLGNWLARHVVAIELDPDRTPVRAAGGTFNEFGFEHLPVRLVRLADARRHDWAAAQPA